jgi:hypothetical protein
MDPIGGNFILEHLENNDNDKSKEREGKIQA